MSWRRAKGISMWSLKLPDVWRSGEEGRGMLLPITWRTRKRMKDCGKSEESEESEERRWRRGGGLQFSLCSDCFHRCAIPFVADRKSVV